MAPLQMQQMLINQNAMLAALTAHIGGGGAGPAGETARFAKLAGEWDKLTGAFSAQPHGVWMQESRRLRAIGVRLDMWTTDSLSVLEGLGELPDRIIALSPTIQQWKAGQATMVRRLQELRAADLAALRLSVKVIHITAAWGVDVANVYQRRIEAEQAAKAAAAAAGDKPYEWLGDHADAHLAEALKYRKETDNTATKLNASPGSEASAAAASAALIAPQVDLTSSSSIVSPAPGASRPRQPAQPRYQQQQVSTQNSMIMMLASPRGVRPFWQLPSQFTERSEQDRHRKLRR
jgi:hypothetical protein